MNHPSADELVAKEKAKVLPDVEPFIRGHCTGRVQIQSFRRVCCLPCIPLYHESRSRLCQFRRLDSAYVNIQRILIGGKLDH